MNPPYIDSKLPAFSGNILTIPFDLNRSVSLSEFDSIQVLVKTVQTNTVCCDKKSLYEEDTRMQYGHKYYATCTLDFTPIPGQYYKVQIAFRKNDTVGYYSNVGVVKCTHAPEIYIENLNFYTTSSNQYTYTGVYKNEDSTEKVYNYFFNVYDKNNNLYETSGLLIHNATKDTELTSSTDTWSPTKGLLPGETYFVEYGVKTLNLLNVSPVKYRISDKFLAPPPSWFKGELSAEVDYNNGAIILSLNGTNLSGKFILNRSSSADNFQTWYKITEFTIANALSGIEIWRDYTVQQGEKYLYSIQMYNDKGLYTSHMVNKEHQITADFEDMFLFDGKRQLKIRFNPKISSFKTVKLESKIDTIGSQFPYFFANAHVKYKEFPISGLVSILSDEDELFFVQQDKSNTSVVQYGNYSNKQTSLTTDNIYTERLFKMEVLDWLQDGQYKLFRSPGEGNYIVKLLNTSLSPNDTLGRMVHTFNSTAYEAMEYTFENLKNNNFLNVDEHLNLQSQHVSTKLNVFDKPYNGILIQETIVTAQDDLLMSNIIIKDTVPLTTIKVAKGNTTQTYTTDITGTVYIEGSWNQIIFNEEVALSIATLEFDFVYNLESDCAEWTTFNTLKKVNSVSEVKLTNLYSKGNWNNKYVNNDNTFDYLKYLNDTQSGSIGEVYYLYVRKRTFANKAETAIANHIIHLKSHGHYIEPISVSEGWVYRNLGTLSEFSCGNGYDVDIVYLQKSIS